MRYLSTFSGIGGFELGIQLAYEKLCIKNKEQGLQGVRDTKGLDSQRNNLSEHGLTCIGYSEIDKYAATIYQKHFPYEQCENCRMARERECSGSPQRGQEEVNLRGTRLPQNNGDINNINISSPTKNNCECRHKPYGDITKIVAEDLPDFDLLVGGFPCQAFSIAGKRGGFEDTRGTMFFELARILRAKQPRLFVFENVKGLLSHDGGKSFSTIIQTLDELGYDCQWQVLNSKNHGVPQNRERVFIIGHLRGTSRPEVFPFGETDREHSDKTEKLREQNSNTLRTNYGGATSNETYVAEINQLNNPTHSNDRVYGADGISPTLNTMQGGNRQPFVKVPEATKKGYAEATVGQSINLAVPNSKTRRGRVSDVAQTLDTGMQQHTLTSDMKIRRLTPVECERLQGFPDGWTDSVSDTQRYKTLGNAVTVNVIHSIMSKLLA